MSAPRPIIIGIVGDSAAGKTTVTQGLVNILGTERVTHVCSDDYHRYDRRERAEMGVSALHPQSNYLDIMQLHMERLHYGQPILKPVYDHSDGSLVRPEYVVPAEVVIVEGLLGFATPVLRGFYDVKVFLDPVDELRELWKIKRDTAKRGYTVEQVRASLAKRREDTAKSIMPQREFADIVVRFFPPEGTSVEEAGANLNVRLVLRPTIPHPDLSYLFDNDKGSSADINLQLGRDHGRPVDFLEIEGGVTAEKAAELELAIWQHLPDLQPVAEDEFGDYQDKWAVRHSHPLALTQLLLVYHVLRKYRDISDMPFAAPVAALRRLAATSAGSAIGVEMGGDDYGDRAQQ